MGNLEKIQDAIINGARFNGVIYQKNNGKHWVTLFVYIDNKFIKLEEVQKEEATSKKRNTKLHWVF